MRNYQRILSVALITTLTSGTIASTHAWAGEITYTDRSYNVPVQRKEVITHVDMQQRRAIDVVRDDSSDLTCKKYSGMDQQVLQAKYDDLSLEHKKTLLNKPAGSVGAGAVAGGALALVAGVAAAPLVILGGLLGGLFGWFRSGKTDQERELAQRKTQAQYDQENLELNCMENELNKFRIYAGTIPAQAPAGVNSSGEQKVVTNNATCQYNNSCGSSAPVAAPLNNGSGASGSGSASGDVVMISNDTPNTNGNRSQSGSRAPADGGSGRVYVDCVL